MSTLTEFFTPLLMIGEKNTSYSTSPRLIRLTGKKRFFLWSNISLNTLVSNSNSNILHFTMMLNKILHSNAPRLTEDCSQNSVVLITLTTLHKIIYNFTAPRVIHMIPSTKRTVRTTLLGVMVDLCS